MKKEEGARMIEIQNASLNEGMMTGPVWVDPHKALQALVEQAADVLEEWGINPRCTFRQEGNRSSWISTKDQKPPKDRLYIAKDEATKDVWVDSAMDEYFDPILCTHWMEVPGDALDKEEVFTPAETLKDAFWDDAGLFWTKKKD